CPQGDGDGRGQLSSQHGRARHRDPPSGQQPQQHVPQGHSVFQFNTDEGQCQYGQCADVDVLSSDSTVGKGWGSRGGCRASKAPPGTHPFSASGNLSCNASTKTE